jgi:UDP-N-acetylmuramoyl-tripeptide--D-alanyl-D-alanine ligase
MDTYAAISAKASRKVMVLGELNELGDHAEGVYQRLAAAASSYGFDLLVGIGHGPDQWVDQLNQKHGSCCLSYEHVEEAIEKLPSHLVPGDHLLIKASRGARLERLAEALLADHEDSKVGGETKKVHHDPTSGMSGPSVRKVLAGAVSAGLGGMIS